MRTAEGGFENFNPKVRNKSKKINIYKNYFLNLLYSRFKFLEFSPSQNGRFNELAYNRGTSAAYKIPGAEKDNYKSVIIFDYTVDKNDLNRNGTPFYIKPTETEIKNSGGALPDRKLQVGKEVILFWELPYYDEKSDWMRLRPIIEELVEIDEVIMQISRAMRVPFVFTGDERQKKISDNRQVENFFYKLFNDYNSIFIDRKNFDRLTLFNTNVNPETLNILLALRNAKIDWALETIGFTNLGRGENSHKSHLLNAEVKQGAELTDDNATTRLLQREQYARNFQDLFGGVLTPLIKKDGSYIDPETAKKYYKIKGASAVMGAEEGGPSLISVSLADNTQNVFFNKSYQNYEAPAGGSGSSVNFSPGSAGDGENSFGLNFDFLNTLKSPDGNRWNLYYKEGQKLADKNIKDNLNLKNNKSFSERLSEFFFNKFGGLSESFKKWFKKDKRNTTVINPKILDDIEKLPEFNFVQNNNGSIVWDEQVVPQIHYSYFFSNLIKKDKLTNQIKFNSDFLNYKIGLLKSYINAGLGFSIPIAFLITVVARILAIQNQNNNHLFDVEKNSEAVGQVVDEQILKLFEFVENDDFANDWNALRWSDTAGIKYISNFFIGMSYIFKNFAKSSKHLANRVFSSLLPNKKLAYLSKILFNFITRQIVYDFVYTSYSNILSYWSSEFYDENHPYLKNFLASLPAAFVTAVYGNSYDPHAAAKYAINSIFIANLQFILNYLTNNPETFNNFFNSYFILKMAGVDLVSQHVIGLIYSVILNRIYDPNPGIIGKTVKFTKLIINAGKQGIINQNGYFNKLLNAIKAMGLEAEKHAGSLQPFYDANVEPYIETLKTNFIDVFNIFRLDVEDFHRRLYFIEQLKNSDPNAFFHDSEIEAIFNANTQNIPQAIELSFSESLRRKEIDFINRVFNGVPYEQAAGDILNQEIEEIFKNDEEKLKDYLRNRPIIKPPQRFREAEDLQKDMGEAVTALIAENNNKLVENTESIINEMYTKIKAFKKLIKQLEEVKNNVKVRVGEGWFELSNKDYNNKNLAINEANEYINRYQEFIKDIKKTTKRKKIIK